MSSDSEFVTALHKKTGLVSQVPRSYVESVYPHLYKELSDEEIVELRREKELEMYGEYVTPAPKKAVEPKTAPKEGAK